MPASYWRGDQQPGSLPPRTGYFVWQRYEVDADSGKRPRVDLSFLSDMWLHRLLGERWLSWNRHRCHRQLRRPPIPPANNRRVGGITPPMGLLAARYTAHARGEARLIKRHTSVLCEGKDFVVFQPSLSSSLALPMQQRRKGAASWCNLRLRCRSAVEIE